MESQFEMDNLRRQLESKDREVKLLNRQIESDSLVHTMLMAERSNVAKLEREVKSLKREISEITVQGKTVMKKYALSIIRELDRDVLDQKPTRARKFDMDKVNGADGETQLLVTLLIELRNHLQDSLKEVDSLKALYSKKIDDLSYTVTQRDKEIIQLTQDNKNQKTQFEERIYDLNGAIASEQAKFEKANKRIQELEETISGAEAEKNELRREVRKLQRDNGSQDLRIKALETQVASSSNSTSSYSSVVNDQMNMLKQDLQLREDDVERLEQKVKLLDDAVRREQKGKAELQDEVNRLQDRVTQLSKKSTSKLDNVVINSSNTSELKSQIDSLKLERDELALSTSKFQREAESLRNSLEDEKTETSRLNKQVESLGSMKTRLKDELNDLEKELDEARAQKNALRKEVSELKLKLTRQGFK